MTSFFLLLKNTLFLHVCNNLILFFKYLGYSQLIVHWTMFQRAELCFEKVNSVSKSSLFHWTLIRRTIFFHWILIGKAELYLWDAVRMCTAFSLGPPAGTWERSSTLAWRVPEVSRMTWGRWRPWGRAPATARRACLTTGAPWASWWPEGLWHHHGVHRGRGLHGRRQEGLQPRERVHGRCGELQQNVVEHQPRPGGCSWTWWPRGHQGRWPTVPRTWRTWVGEGTQFKQILWLLTLVLVLARWHHLEGGFRQEGGRHWEGGPRCCSRCRAEKIGTTVDSWCRVWPRRRNCIRSFLLNSFF